MQGLTTLIQGNLTLIDQIDTKGAASSLTLALGNIRQLLNEISKLIFLEKPYLDSQRGQFSNLCSLESNTPPKIYQWLLRVILQKDTEILPDIEAEYLLEDHDEEDSRAHVITELYESLVDHIKNRWIFEGKYKLRTLQKENRLEEIQQEMEIQEFKDILRQLQNELNYMIKGTNEKQIDTDAKSKKKSLEEVHHAEFHQKSSVRSLLTEKLKNLQPINNDDDVSCIDGKILVKSNWIMKQMKENSRGNATQPINNISSNASEGSLSENVYSVGLYPSTMVKGALKTRFQGQRTILKEINLDMPLSSEKKAKKEKSGCAQCDIY